jgi:hypothetical protein
VAAVLLASGTDDEGCSESIPTANPCRTADGWMVELGAREHLECKLTTSPPPEDLELPALVYGRFSSAGTARRGFDEGIRFEQENGAQSCPRSSLRRMEDVFSQGDTDCFIDGDGEYIQMWWNADGSR